MVGKGLKILEIEPVRIGRVPKPLTENDHTHFFFCPACNYVHCFTASKQGYDNNPYYPTLSEQIHIPGQLALFTCISKVEKGTIRYSHKCTHEFKGETLQLPILK